MTRADLGRRRRRLAVRRRQPALRRVRRAATSPPGSACGSATRCSTWRRSRPPTCSDLRTVFEAPSLNPLLALGRAGVERPCGAWLTAPAQRRVAPRPRRAAPGAARRGDAAAAVRGRRLRRLLRSLDHATNVGRIFRPDQEPLLPNWRHLPVGYHGRAGTVVVVGHRRSSGRTASARRPPTPPRRSARAPASTSRPSSASWSAPRPRWATGSPSAAFADHVFGVVGLNDWSARDIQAWEYVPLGPFLGKSFATSISDWVTPLEALDAAWVDLPGQDPRAARLPRASTAGRGLDIDIEVELNGDVVSRPPYASMYWSPAQMLAHLTVNGASLRTGDLFASGTVSAAPSPTSAARSSSCPGAAASRSRSATRSGPSSRTATRWCCATPHPAPSAAGSRSARSADGSTRPAEPAP